MDSTTLTRTVRGTVAGGILLCGAAAAAAETAAAPPEATAPQPAGAAKPRAAADAHRHRPHAIGTGHEADRHRHGAAEKPAASRRAGPAVAHAHGPRAGSADHADAADEGHGHDHAGHDDAITEFLFAFTTGSDIAPVLHRHILTETTGGLGKATGTYAAVSNRVELGFVPWENFHVGLGTSFAYHRISGVQGLEAPAPVGAEAAGEGAEPALLHRDKAAFDGLSLEFRQRFLDRARAPFGLTLVVEPHWGRVEELTGAPVDKHAIGFLLAADKDIIPDTLFTAINVFYEPEWVKARDNGENERESTFGVSTAAMVRLAPSWFVGGDARYLRSYDGAGLQSLAGEAFFVGPALYAQLGDLLLSAAWSVQAWGHVAGGTGSLDLDTFTRHQGKLRLVAHF